MLEELKSYVKHQEIVLYLQNSICKGKEIHYILNL